MESTRVALLARVVAYTTEQCQWIRSQKADAKNPEVLPPVAAFPTFVAQTLELCNGKVLFTISVSILLYYYCYIYVYILLYYRYHYYCNYLIYSFILLIYIICSIYVL